MKRDGLVKPKRRAMLRVGTASSAACNASRTRRSRMAWSAVSGVVSRNWRNARRRPAAGSDRNILHADRLEGLSVDELVPRVFKASVDLRELADNAVSILTGQGS